MVWGSWNDGVAGDVGAEVARGGWVVLRGFFGIV